MRHSSRTRSIRKSLCIALVAALVILGVYDSMLPQAVLACPGPVGPTYPGTEALDSTITLQMPFIAGEIWTVGGAGSFYGNNEHCNDPNNDYYATDWNKTNDDGASVLPVADGVVSNIQAPPCPEGGLGCYVQIDHANGYRTRYAHLSLVLVANQASVHTWTLIGKVGDTGLPAGSGSHLHLTFRRDNGGYFSHCNTAIAPSTTCPNGEARLAPQGHRPSPMLTTLGPTVLQDGQTYTSVNGRVYLADLHNNNNGWTSEFYVRNDGTESRNITTTYFTSSGTPTVSDICVLNLNQWCWIPVNLNNRLPAGATGSAFMNGGEAVSVVAVNRNAIWGSGYAYTGRTAPTSTLYLPETLDLNTSTGTFLMSFPVLNTGPAATNVTATFFNSSGSLRTTQVANGVAANGLSTEFPTSDIAAGNDYYGAGVVTTTVQPLATVVRVYDNTHRRLGYLGISVISTTVWLPFVMTRLANDWGATIWVQNTTNVASTVTVDFYQEGSSSVYKTTGQVALPAKGMTSFNLRTNNYGLGWGWYGSARVSAGQPVAIVVNQLQDATFLGASYEGIPASAGSNAVVLPYAVRQYNSCYYSNFTVRNLGSADATVRIRYYDGNGNLVASSSSNETVKSHVVYNLYLTTPPSNHVFPPLGFSGSAVISGTNSQPIAASSNLVDKCASNNDTISYTGINR